MLYESSREFASVYRLCVQSRIKSDGFKYWLCCRSAIGVCRPVSGVGSWFGHPPEGVRGAKTHGDYLLEFRANWRERRMGRCSRGFGDACLSYFGTVLSCKESVDGQIISVTF